MRGRRGGRISSEEPGPEVRGRGGLGGGRGVLLLLNRLLCRRGLQGRSFRIIRPEHCHTDYLLPGEAGCLATPDNEYQENIEE